jgi:WD40 repeat protein
MGVTRGQKLRELKSANGFFSAVSFSPDGRTLATGTSGGTMIMWDVQSGKITRELPAHSAGVTSLSFSPNGRYVATASRDKTVCLWDAATGERCGVLAGSIPVAEESR